MYSIKAITKQTKISAHTLRAWERRYQAISPSRSSNGRRTYSQSELHRLNILKSLIEQGHSISKIASLCTEELHRLKYEDTAPKSVPSLSSNELATLHLAITEILSLIQNYKLKEIHFLFTSLRYRFTARNYTLNFIIPMLKKMGEQVEQGLLDLTHEHALSAILRQILSELFFSFQNSLFFREKYSQIQVTVVLSTPENELHEFGILIAAILFSFYGFNVFYLGPNLPAQSLIMTAKSLKADLIVLGTSQSKDKNYKAGLRNYVQKLIEHPSKKSSEIWLGGQFQILIDEIYLSNKKLKNKILGIEHHLQLEEKIQEYIQNNQ